MLIVTERLHGQILVLPHFILPVMVFIFIYLFIFGEGAIDDLITRLGVFLLLKIVLSSVGFINMLLATWLDE